jgi:hypothetical protein
LDLIVINLIKVSGLGVKGFRIYFPSGKMME